MIRNNINFQRASLAFIPIFILISIFLLSCKEDVLDVGIELLAEDELLNASFDTLDVNAYTIEGQGLYTYRRSVSPLGYYQNEVFGGVRNDILLNYYRSKSFTIPENYKVVDVELRLDYSGYIGDIEDIDFDVYEINGDFPPDSINSDYEVTQDMIYSIPVSTGSIDTIGGLLIVPLKTTFGEKLFDKSAWNPEDSIYKTDSVELFWKYFKGLYLKGKESSGNGALAYISLFSDYSMLRLKYANDDDDTLSFSYYFVKSHNLRSFDYSNSEFSDLGSMTEKSEVLLQSLGGTRALIQIPGLEELRNSTNTYSVSRAELVFYVDSNLVDTNIIPTRVALKYPYEEEETELPLADYYGFESYFGGYINKNTWECRMNISNWVQSYISGSVDIYTDPSLIMHIANYLQSDGINYVYRMDYITSSYLAIPLFTGNSEHPPHLNLVYSIIE
jgi:hypothetical protein